MPPILRSTLVVAAGVLVGVVVVSVADGVVHRAYPLPAGTDASNPESLAQAVAGMPLPAFIMLLAGWVLAAFAASFGAARLAARSPAAHGLVAALLLLAATIANLAAVPHPTWMWPAAIVLLPLAGWAATRLVKPRLVPSP